jgi:hypothetical protein
VQFLDAIAAAFQPSIANDAATLTKQHYACLKSTGKRRIELRSCSVVEQECEFRKLPVPSRPLFARALDSVEKLPPHVERALDRGPHHRAFDLAHRRVTQNIVADVAVVAIGDFVHVEKRDLVAR